MIVSLLIFYGVNVISSFAVSKSDKFTPIYRPQLEVNRTSENIDIDGRLSEPAWMSAAIADNFDS
jgi:hypothetical protein